MMDFLGGAMLTLTAPVASLASRAMTGVPMFRSYFFGTTDEGAALQLPPVVHFGDLMHMFRTHGIWGHHLMDRDLAASHGSILCIIPPIALGGGGEGGPCLYMNISEPSVVRQVLLDKVTFPTRGRSGLSDRGVAQGLVELPTGPRHSFHRRIIGSLLTDKHLRVYATTVQEEVEVLLGKWSLASESGATVNAHYDLAMCTEDIIGIIGLGQTFNAQGVREEDNTVASDRAFMLRRAALGTATGKRVLNWVSPTSHQEREKQIKANTAGETAVRVRSALGGGAQPATDSINSNRNSKTADDEEGALDNEPTNMVAALKQAVDPEMGKLTDREILDEFVTIRGAGHETTSNTLSWAIMLLAQNPVEQDRLFTEVDRGIAGSTPTVDEAEELRLCHMCIYETLRLFPTVPSFPRLAVQNCRLGGFDVPAGTLVFVSQSAMNCRTDLWGTDAAEFRPLRFDRPGYSLDLVQSRPKGCPGFTPSVAAAGEGETAQGGCPAQGKQGPEFGFVPFGAGPRTCPGQRFALLESTIILASLVKSFRIELAAPDEPVQEMSDITLGPKKGLRIKVYRRKTASQSRL